MERDGFEIWKPWNVTTQYQIPAGRKAKSNRLPITADDMLAAARRLDRYTHRTAPQPIELRIVEDGSVFYFERARNGVGHLSLAGVNIAVREMYGRDRSIPLWQKLTTLCW